MRNFILVLAAFSLISIGSASAQQSAPRPAGPEDRAIFLPLCHRLIVARDAEGMAEYCGAAAQLLFNIHRSEGQTPHFSQEETESLLEAAWANGVNGIHHIDRERPIEFVPMANQAQNLRIAVYATLAGLRHNSGRDAANGIGKIAEAAGVDVSNHASLVDMRLRAMAALVAQPQSPERDWGVVALALTLQFGPPGRSDADRAADVHAILDQLQRVHPNASSGTLDAVLPALFSEANALGRYELRDYAGAAHGYEAAALDCAAQAWPAANICMHMRFQAARAQFRVQDAVDHPELVSAPQPAEVATPFTNPQPDETRPCQVLTIADVASDGSVVNPRMIYEDPPGLCTELARAYVASRRYTPTASSRPGERRVNVIITLERRRP